MKSLTKKCRILLLIFILSVLIRFGKPNFSTETGSSQAGRKRGMRRIGLCAAACLAFAVLIFLGRWSAGRSRETAASPVFLQTLGMDAGILRNAEKLMEVRSSVSENANVPKEVIRFYEAEYVEQELDEEGLENTDSGEKIAESLIDPAGMTLIERIRTPQGYRRITAKEGSFAEFLRNYSLKEDGSPILYYNRKKKKASDHAAVFTMHLEPYNLQQCADSVIRLYAEYLRKNGMTEEIAFRFTSGFLYSYRTFLDGGNLQEEGVSVNLVYGEAREDTEKGFEEYLSWVFNYAGTYSLAAESEKIELKDIQPGDIFIKAGSPGHVVMVVDVCKNKGKTAFLLAQGDMPAQEFHLLKNPRHKDDPWYYVDEIGNTLQLPNYSFRKNALRRPIYLKNLSAEEAD